MFCTSTGLTIGHRNLTGRGLGKACERASITGVTFHALRHTFASLLIDQGHDPVFVSRQLGHANAAITLFIRTSSMRRVTRSGRAQDWRLGIATCSANPGRVSDSTRADGWPGQPCVGRLQLLARRDEPAGAEEGKTSVRTHKALDPL